MARINNLLNILILIMFLDHVLLCSWQRLPSASPYDSLLITVPHKRLLIKRSVFRLPCHIAIESLIYRGKWVEIFSRLAHVHIIKTSLFLMILHLSSTNPVSTYCSTLWERHCCRSIFRFGTAVIELLLWISLFRRWYWLKIVATISSKKRETILIWAQSMQSPHFCVYRVENLNGSLHQKMEDGNWCVSVIANV